MTLARETIVLASASASRRAMLTAAGVAIDIVPAGIDERALEAEMCQKHPGCRIATEQMSNAPLLSPRAENPAADLAKALTGENATGVVSYAAEAGQFQEAGFSTVICGPGSIEQAHQPNEFISLTQVAEGTAFLRKLIARLAA